MCTWTKSSQQHLSRYQYHAYPCICIASTLSRYQSQTPLCTTSSLSSYQHHTPIFTLHIQFQKMYKVSTTSTKFVSVTKILNYGGAMSNQAIIGNSTEYPWTIWVLNYGAMMPDQAIIGNSTQYPWVWGWSFRDIYDPFKQEDQSGLIFVLGIFGHHHDYLMERCLIFLILKVALNVNKMVLQAIGNILVENGVLCHVSSNTNRTDIWWQIGDMLVNI